MRNCWTYKDSVPVEFVLLGSAFAVAASSWSVVAKLGLGMPEGKKHSDSFVPWQVAHSGSADRARHCLRNYWYPCISLYP